MSASVACKALSCYKTLTAIIDEDFYTTYLAIGSKDLAQMACRDVARETGDGDGLLLVSLVEIGSTAAVVAPWHSWLPSFCVIG